MTAPADPSRRAAPADPPRRAAPADPSRRKRRGRNRLRIQLALLYAIPFLLSGVVLLGFPLLSMSQTQPVGSLGGQPHPPPPDGGLALRNQVIASVVGLAVMAVVALALGWFIAGRFLRPLRTITATARDISSSNLHRRLALRGRRTEFTELADTLNDLFARLEAAFDAQRHFVANAAHELRTPLTAERTLLQVALADPERDVDSLSTAAREVIGLGVAQERLIAGLLTLASGERGLDARRPVDLATLAGRAVAERLADAQRRGLTVTSALGAAPVSGDPDLLGSLVANLVDNAHRHNVSGGRIEISTGTDGGAHVTVANTGPAVPPEEVDRLFRPFERLGTARTGRSGGHGLGLAIVAAIATAHAAAVTAHALPAGGLSITVRFPGADA